MGNGLEESGEGTEEKEEEPYAESGRTMPGTPREAAQTLPYCQVGACKTVARKAQHGAKSHAARCDGRCSALRRPMQRAAKEHAVHCIGHRTEVHFTAQLHVPHHTVSFAHDHRTQTSVGKAPQKPSLAPPPFTPNGIPTPDRTLDGSKAMHLNTAGKAARPHLLNTSV